MEMVQDPWGALQGPLGCLDLGWDHPCMHIRCFSHAHAFPLKGRIRLLCAASSLPASWPLHFGAVIEESQGPPSTGPADPPWPSDDQGGCWEMQGWPQRGDGETLHALEGRSGIVSCCPDPHMS